MKRLLAAALVAGGTVAAFASPSQASTIGIDFGCTGADLSGFCTPGDAPLQSGYQAWTGQHTDSGIDHNETRSFNAAFGVGGTFSLNIVSNDLYFRDYYELTGGPYAGQSDLLSDMILRNTLGSIVFNFSGLTAGEYSMESFHHSTRFAEDTGPAFDVIVTDLLGTRTVVSGIDPSSGISPTTIAIALYALTVGADGTASVTFTTADYRASSIMPVNGFQLTGPSPVPLPAGFWLLLSALGGLGVARWRRKAAA